MSADRITYVGHATALLELDGVRVLTDPMLRPRLLRVIVRHSPAPDPEIAKRIDAVLISHLHHDHLDFASLRRIGLGVRVIAPPGGGRVIRRRGFENVIELAAGETTLVRGVEVRATDAIHDGRRHKIGPRVDAIGYLLRTPARTVYFAGDTDLFEGMDELAGNLDAALLPIGGWGTKVGAGHLDPGRAAVAAARRPRAPRRRPSARAAATVRRSARRARAHGRGGRARARRVAGTLTWTVIGLVGWVGPSWLVRPVPFAGVPARRDLDPADCPVGVEQAHLVSAGLTRQEAEACCGVRVDLLEQPEARDLDLVDAFGRHLKLELVAELERDPRRLSPTGVDRLA